MTSIAHPLLPSKVGAGWLALYAIEDAAHNTVQAVRHWLEVEPH